METIQKNAVGVEMVYTIYETNGGVFDLSGATSIDLTFKKPDGTTVTKTATKVTDGADGKVKYLSETGVLNQKDIWSVQVKITGSGYVIPSEIGSFRVEDNLI